VEDRQNIAFERLEHGLEKAARKDRRPEIAHALGIHRVEGRYALRPRAHADEEVLFQAFAHFGPLSLGDSKQLGLIVRGQIGGKAAMAVGSDGPVPRRGPAAQFDRRAGEARGQFFRSAAQGLRGGSPLRQHPAADRKAARGEHSPEDRRVHLAQR
jgi:hypothetical protein